MLWRQFFFFFSFLREFNLEDPSHCIFVEKDSNGILTWSWDDIFQPCQFQRQSTSFNLRRIIVKYSLVFWEHFVNGVALQEFSLDLEVSLRSEGFRGYKCFEKTFWISKLIWILELFQLHNCWTLSKSKLFEPWNSFSFRTIWTLELFQNQNFRFLWI